MIYRSKSPRDLIAASTTLDSIAHRTAMSLQTRRPPGHAKRKALTYAADIINLRGHGHSYSAIREALEDAGVLVSISTVRREAMRGPSAIEAFKSTAAPLRPHVGQAGRTAVAIPAAATAPVLGAMPLPGKAIAEEFMRGRPTNTLFLKEPST
jgi:hypothetical protein